MLKQNRKCVKCVCETQLSPIMANSNDGHANVKVFLKVGHCPRGAVVRAEAQRSGDPCVPGSNPTVGRGCRSFG